MKTDGLNFEYLNARRLILPMTKSVNLVLIGCGGTGSWLAPAVARYARMLTENFDKEVKVTFIDPDRVEAKNVYRQNFCDAEIGSFKAQTLAARFSMAWGVPIVALNDAYKSNTVLPSPGQERLTVLVGCVDNTSARREILRYLNGISSPIWWLDCGNKKTVGQVLLGRKLQDKEKPLALDGYSTWLPLPSSQHPELVDVTAEPAPSVATAADESMLSCAELAMRGSQSLSVNFRMAAAASEMLGKLLLTNDLENYAVYIDEAVGETRKFITAENIQHALDLFNTSGLAGFEAKGNSSMVDEGALDIEDDEDEE